MQQAEDLFHEIKKSIYAFIEQNQYKAVYTVSGGIVKNGDVDNSFENAMKLSGVCTQRGEGARKKQLLCI